MIVQETKSNKKLFRVPNQKLTTETSYMSGRKLET